jgi:hypothetical protein
MIVQEGKERIKSREEKRIRCKGISFVVVFAKVMILLFYVEMPDSLSFDFPKGCIFRPSKIF